MSSSLARLRRKKLERDNLQYPHQLVPIPRDDWPLHMPAGLDRVFRSCNFLVQVFVETNGAVRLSVCRTEIDGASWKPGISWDDLQIIKNQCGYSDQWAVEVYPPDEAVVNVSNMRHLWIIKEKPEFAW